MSSSTHKSEVTLNSGVFHIPTLGPGFITNDRLVITIKNHSNKTLQADVIIDRCLPGFTGITLPSVRNLAESTLQAFPRENIPPHTCRVYEVAIAPDSRPFIKVISTGDYEVIEGRPAGGKLEISVVAGQGRTPFTGLFAADASTFVPYGDWVVEEKHHCDSDSDSGS